MNEPKDFDYETRLNIQYAPLEVIDEKSLADACRFKWYNQTLCKVNGSVVRLGVVEGENITGTSTMTTMNSSMSWREISSLICQSGRFDWLRGKVSSFPAESPIVPAPKSGP